MASQTDRKAVLVSEPVRKCMRDEGMPLVRVLEHGLPPALQTHEILVCEKTKQILVTQMEEGRLVKLDFDDDGHIDSAVTTANMNLDTSLGINHDPFVGMHGLAASELYPGHAWVTLQYINQIVLIDLEDLKIKGTITCPRTGESKPGVTEELIFGGPHCLVEKGGQLFICLKGGASCHGATATRDLAEDATGQGVYRVTLDPVNLGTEIPGSGVVFRVPPTPVMCVVDDEQNCWVVTDADPSVTKIPGDATSTADLITVMMPFGYSSLAQTGPGLQIGPDGNPWFCILLGDGLVGKIDRHTNQVKVFELHTKPWNPTPRICHISWDAKGILYAISSDLLDKTAVNSLIRLKFDKDFDQIIAQHELALPSQASCIHRIAHMDSQTEPSVLVTELTQSQILQVYKSTLPPLESYPMKTMTLTIHKVVDALRPCGRAGIPECSCMLTDNGIWISAVAKYEGVDAFYDPEKLSQVAKPMNHPITGEAGFWMDVNTWGTDDWMQYPHKSLGENGPETDVYAANGARRRQVDKNKIPRQNALKYKPEQLMNALKKEPYRIPLMGEEMADCGISPDAVFAAIEADKKHECKNEEA